MSERERYSYEYTVFTILEYLYEKKQSEPVSKYNIMTRTRLPTQRPDRVDSILNLLVNRGWISLVKTEYSSFYKITGDGEKEYNRWIKEFLDFTRSLYRK